MVIIDTDILIDSAHNIDDAVNCLHQLEQNNTLTISSITQMELIVGCRNKNELNALNRFLSRFHIISLDNQITAQALHLLKQYNLSHGLLIADAFIASTAVVLNHELISKNQRDYRFIDDLQLLPYPIFS